MEQQQQQQPSPPPPWLIALLFRHWPLIMLLFMALVSSLFIIITRSAVHGHGNPCHWSKVARPPHTTNHISHYHVLHIQPIDMYSISLCRKTQLISHFANSLDASK